MGYEEIFQGVSEYVKIATTVFKVLSSFLVALLAFFTAAKKFGVTLFKKSLMVDFCRSRVYHT